MARASEQFRQGDVATWGIVALVCASLAILAGNINTLLPPALIHGLHKSRLDSASLDQLRFEVGALREQTVRLARDNETVATRLDLQEQAGTQTTQRVGALEVSLPQLLEALPDDAAIDRSAITASIGTDEGQSFEADGGSVTVRSQPLVIGAPSDASPQALPDLAAATPRPGAAIGSPATPGNAAAQWSDLSAKLGPLLLGFEARLSGPPGEQRIVIGPFPAAADAMALCTRLESVAIPCSPQPFAGAPLPAS